MRIEVGNRGRYAVVDIPECVVYMPNLLKFVFHDLKCHSLQGFLVELFNGETELYTFNSNDFFFQTDRSLEDFTRHIQGSYVLAGMVFDKYEEAKLVKYEFEKILTFQALKESYQ